MGFFRVCWREDGAIMLEREREEGLLSREEGARRGKGWHPLGWCSGVVTRHGWEKSSLEWSMSLHRGRIASDFIITGHLNTGRNTASSGLLEYPLTLCPMGHHSCEQTFSSCHLQHFQTSKLELIWHTAHAPFPAWGPSSPPAADGSEVQQISKIISAYVFPAGWYCCSSFLELSAYSQPARFISRAWSTRGMTKAHWGRNTHSLVADLIQVMFICLWWFWS